MLNERHNTEFKQTNLESARSSEVVLSSRTVFFARFLAAGGPPRKGGKHAPTAKLASVTVSVTQITAVSFLYLVLKFSSFSLFIRFKLYKSFYEKS